MRVSTAPTTLLPAQRRAWIQQALRRTGAVATKDVAKHLGITEQTARRDINHLAVRGVGKRVYGGIVQPWRLNPDAR